MAVLGGFWRFEGGSLAVCAPPFGCIQPANACHLGRAGRDLCASCVSERAFGRVSGRTVARRGDARREIGAGICNKGAGFGDDTWFTLRKSR
jgi:hypothetical protein